MRAWRIMITVLCIAACSARGDRSDAVRDAAPPRDGGADGDHGEMGVDAGGTDSGGEAGAADAGRDAGAMDAGRDAGAMDAGRDAGAMDAGRDAGPVDIGVDLDVDLGPAPLNDTCTSAIDITGLGTFTGTTCGADDTITLGVGLPFPCETPTTPGTPDVFYVFDASTLGGRALRLVITPGYAIQFVPSVCSGNGGCGPYRSTMDFTIAGGGTFYFAIEASSGCGAFSLTASTF